MSRTTPQNWLVFNENLLVVVELGLAGKLDACSIHRKGCESDKEELLHSRSRSTVRGRFCTGNIPNSYQKYTNNYTLKKTKKWFDVYNVLIETNWYLVMIRCLIVVSNLTCWDVVIFCDLFVKTFISKTICLRYVFEKVPSAKWPHTLE